MKKILLPLSILAVTFAYSQVGIGTSTPNTSSILELQASDKGLLLPRVALTDVALAAPLAAHVQGMVVYNTAATITGHTGNAEGIWRNDGTKWLKGGGVGTSSTGSDWSLTGNAGTTVGTNFIGTTDAQDLMFKVDNTPSGRINIAKENTSLGYGSNNSGGGNTAIGFNALSINTNGSNVAVGSRVLEASTNAKFNVGLGYNALKLSTGGSGNIAVGAYAGDAITTGSENIIIGGSQDTPTATTDQFLNIGGAIFGTGLTGNQLAPAGNIGIGKVAPAEKLDVAGSFHNQTQLTSGRYTGFYSGLNTIGGGYQSSSIYNMPNPTIGAGELLNYVSVQDGASIIGSTQDVTSATGESATGTFLAGDIYLETKDNNSNSFAVLRVQTPNQGKNLWNSVQDPSGINNSTTIDFDAASPIAFKFSTLGVYSEYRFPRTDGAANQFLQTDGSGNLSWQNGATALIGQTSGLISNPPTGTPTEETFLGNKAGDGATVNYTTAIGSYAGTNASNADYAIFVGISAGEDAVNAYHSIIMGTNAGQGATNANESIFMGNETGMASTEAHSSIFIGKAAGNNAPNSSNSVFIGKNAGLNATDAFDSFFGGSEAGVNAAGASQSVLIGTRAGDTVQERYLSFIGFEAGSNATNARGSNFLGWQAGYNATDANYSSFIGFEAGKNATNASNSSFIGTGAGNGATNAANSIFIGRNAGGGDTINNIGGGTSILIGDSTNTGGFSNSIALGTSATNTASNQFLIHDSYTQLNMRGVNYTMPSAQGTTGSFLRNDGTGVLSWQTPASVGLDTTNDAFINNTASTRVELGTTSTGAARTVGSEFVVTDAGSVGIGTTVPAAKLHVSGATSNPGFIVESTQNASIASLNLTNSSGYSGTPASNQASWSIGVNRHNVNDFVIRNEKTGTSMLNVSNAGNVGIGLAGLSPTAKLHIKDGHIKSEQTTAPTVSGFTVVTGTGTATATVN